jgi:FixJ family two-component response regulator
MRLADRGLHRRPACPTKVAWRYDSPPSYRATMIETRTTIAVVEDDVAVRTALQQLLRSASFDTLTFASAEEFLSAGAMERAHLLIADVNLPGISGVALVQRLAASGSALPAILITGRDDPATRHLIGQAGPVPRLRKPFSDGDLFGAIRTALSA